MEATGEQATRPSPRVIDASVHVFFRSNDDLRDHMREPFKSRGFPDVEMDWYGAPAVSTRRGPSARTCTPGRTRTSPGSSCSGTGMDIAILHPMTRGCGPDRHLVSAVLAAHNEMLASRWLDHGTYGERFRGTIRLNPDDIEGALTELERWRDHPRMVQIGVPLQSHALYGKPQFWPLWEAAADAGLPVALHIETGTGVDSAPTPSGPPRTYPQYVGFMGLNYIYHLMNMIAEGVFERLPHLKVVFADGGGDLLTPLIWRMDTFGRRTSSRPRGLRRSPATTCPDTCTSSRAHWTVRATRTWPPSGSR